MSPVEELREAAKKLREAATAASAGPWEHNVSMHPDVVLALANLLAVMTWFPSMADPTDMNAAVAVARAVLGRRPGSCSTGTGDRR